MNQQAVKRYADPFEKLCFRAVKIASSPWSIALHTIWFITWFVLKLDIETLILVVSLEAIYLCIFILVSSSKELEYDRKRMLADFEVDKQTGKRIKEMSRTIETMKQDIGKLKEKSNASPN